MTDKNDPSLLAAGAALGSLTPEEVAAYEAFLAGSADARWDAGAYEATAVALGMDAPPVAPRPQLKVDIMARIAATPQPAAVDHAPRIPETKAETKAVTKSRARWFTRPVGITAAAAAASVLFLGGTLVGIELGDHSSQEQQQESVLAQINSASDAQRATAAVTGGGTATLVWSDALGKSVLLANGLSILPADKTYELWYIRGDAAHPAGTMDVAQGTTTWRVLDGTMVAGDTVGVTVEPKGGSKQPTTTPVVAIQS